VCAEEKSKRLRAAAAPSSELSAGHFTTPAAVRRRASEVIPTVPFPAGRNSAEALEWELQGPLSEGDVHLLVQVNAMCDWLEHASAEALSDSDRAILADLPHWPMARTLTFNPELADGIAALLAGDTGPVERLLGYCRRPEGKPRSAW